ncbi:MAG: 50S ribosomal protein L18Ae [Candidatus Poseidoniaceae archaeon]|jgi:ribosomal protein L20A (L18A)|nr:50S ribosomal protein L18Ae [Candidatus Poseidoniaceae archaeon]
MQAFRTTGTALFGRTSQPFSLDLVATDAADAEHRCYSIIGSRHKVGRRFIEIESTSKIDPKTSNEARVLHFFRDQIEAEGGRIAPAEEE